MARSTARRDRELLAGTSTLGGCPPGEARLTRGYRLPARYVVHTVGPIWRGGDAGEKEILARCYVSCLAIARERQFGENAFPAIATGIYGFPPRQAAMIAVGAVRCHLDHEAWARHVIFVCFDTTTFDLHQATSTRPHWTPAPDDRPGRPAPRGLAHSNRPQ